MDNGEFGLLASILGIAFISLLIAVTMTTDEQSESLEDQDFSDDSDLF